MHLIVPSTEYENYFRKKQLWITHSDICNIHVKNAKANVKFMKKPQSFIVPQNRMKSQNCCSNILSRLQMYFSIIWAAFAICQPPYLIIYLHDDSLQGVISITITLFNDYPVYLHPSLQPVSISLIHCQPSISIARKAFPAVVSWQPATFGSICSVSIPWLLRPFSLHYQ